MHKIITYGTMFVLAFLSSSFTPSSSASSSSSSVHCSSLMATPDIDDEAFVVLGDINIGGFIMTTLSEGPTSCSQSVRPGSIAIEFTETVAYAVKLVNDDPNLLPNITLGFVILNDCANSNVALAKALQFLPRITELNDTCSCNSPNVGLSSLPYNSTQNHGRAMKYFDVIGIISPMWSSPSVLISQLFSTSRIPVVGGIATSDELSDKKSHPYYLRVSSPDKYHVETMLKFIQSNGWTYISVVYVYGSFGEKGYDLIKYRAPEYKICIATAHRVNDRSDYDYVVQDLLKYPGARVVILFTYIDEARAVFKVVRDYGVQGRFIWIGGNGWGTSYRSNFKGYEDCIVGAFTIAYFHCYVPGLYDHIDSLKPNETTNPWLIPYWEHLAGCSFSNGTCDPASSILNTSDFSFAKSSSLYADTVMTFAHAVTKLISDLCPGVTGSAVRSCIEGDVLLEYLKNVSFDGYSGHVEFNEFGDVEGTYEIQQIVIGFKDIPHPNIISTLGLVPNTVALYDVKRKQVNYTGTPISWDHLSKWGSSRLGMNDYSTNVPESVCSQPCLLGEYKIQKDVECCWECRKCRDNERLVNGNSSCEDCELFTWPDPETAFTTCREIDPSFPLVSDTVSVIQICIGVIAIVGAVVVGFGYVHYRESRVIKAASKELSILQMFAIVVGYITVILFQFPPSHELCVTLYFLFCLSFAWLYAPLIVKALRVYRIFLSGSKHNRRPRFVSPKSQIVITMILICFQIVLCLVTQVVYGPTAKKTQPVPTEKYVELSCDLTIPGLASFLAYNLVLVLLCSVFAFMTRKLPDNFNESWFMFMCVSTTLIIWLAVVPTYFTASREFVRTLMLSVALLLNHTVALAFLFLPKIYAAIYLPLDGMVSHGLHNHATSFPHHQHPHPPTSSSRVAPTLSPSPPSANHLSVPSPLGPGA